MTGGPPRQPALGITCIYSFKYIYICIYVNIKCFIFIWKRFVAFKTCSIKFMHTEYCIIAFQIYFVNLLYISPKLTGIAIIQCYLFSAFLWELLKYVGQLKSELLHLLERQQFWWCSKLCRIVANLCGLTLPIPAIHLFRTESIGTIPVFIPPLLHFYIQNLYSSH